MELPNNCPFVGSLFNRRKQRTRHALTLLQLGSIVFLSLLDFLQRSLICVNFGSNQSCMELVPCSRAALSFKPELTLIQKRRLGEGGWSCKKCSAGSNQGKVQVRKRRLGGKKRLLSSSPLSRVSRHRKIGQRRRRTPAEDSQGLGWEGRDRWDCLSLISPANSLPP